MFSFIKNIFLVFTICSFISACNSDKKEKKTVGPPKVVEPVTPPIPPSTNIVDTDTVTVESGEFIMGCNDNDYIACQLAKPAHKVYLKAYTIDKYLVTYRRYQACLDAEKCTPLFSGAGCNTGMSWNATHPVNCVNHQQAKNFCQFDGKRLPTEAEWEKAARGTDARKFPWGNQPPSCQLAVMNKKIGNNTIGPGCGAGTTQPVGSKPLGASPYGVADMAGNLFEWTSDWYDKDYFSRSPYHNPTGPKTGEHKVLKGSSWLMRTDNGLASVVRSGYSPLGQGYVVGFRCANDI